MKPVPLYWDAGESRLNREARERYCRHTSAITPPSSHPPPHARVRALPQPRGVTAAAWAEMPVRGSSPSAMVCEASPPEIYLHPLFSVDVCPRHSCRFAEVLLPVNDLPKPRARYRIVPILELPLPSMVRLAPPLDQNGSIQRVLLAMCF